MVVPRIVARAASFAFITIPEAFENIFGDGDGGRLIAEATGEGAAVTAASAGLVQGAIGGVAEAAATQAATEQTGFFSQSISFQQLRTFGGVFTYMTSKWALGCFTVAIILNRTQIYASARRHLSLSWQSRLALRIIPILLFLLQTQSLLRAMRCQTSPRYPEMRYGNPDKHISIDFAGDGGFLYRLSSTLLFWETEQMSCLAVNMIHSEEDGWLSGSLSHLWPMFQSLCLSQFIETLSCAVQGRPVMTETGMSIFEHSLAFAEAEAMVSNKLGLGPFGGKSNAGPQANSTGTESEPTVLVTRAFLLNRLNTPPEVLLMALISCLNNLSSHILGVMGLQSKYRLINTGLWGLCFMSSFVWGFVGFNLDHGVEAGILRFPTVCIVGFIPHLLILVGVFLCGCIYSIALLLSAFSPPPDLPQAATWRERFRVAHDNMQANMQLSNLQLNMHEDFYTALLRIGFAALTAASEAVFLNEGRPLGISRWTWLEEERMNSVEQSRAAKRYDGGAFARHFANEDTAGLATGVAFTEEQTANKSPHPRQRKSGYARERTTKILKTGSAGKNARVGADGVGAYQRGGRYVLAWEFLSSIFWLFTGWLALGLFKVLDKIGIRYRPQWLTKVVGSPKVAKEVDNVGGESKSSTLEFWLLSDEGVLSLPENDDVDVEYQTKRRLKMASKSWGEAEEGQLDSNLYAWWISGGWWGERDNSGEYAIPAEQDNDDDVTSVISEATTSASDADWESDKDHSEGRRTPTQRHPHPYSSTSRDSTPGIDLPLNASQLARLLNPQHADERAEARILAHHLTSTDRILTRSRYQALADSDSAHVLTSTRYRPPGFKAASPDGRLTPFEEAELLEELILRNRAQRDRTATASGGSGGETSTWQDGAEGLGAGGPQCVVCQSAPRTILSWPCRCLSLCEDCRVSLAMNNFATCVCCRQDVVGFSRLFVP